MWKKNTNKNLQIDVFILMPCTSKVIEALVETLVLLEAVAVGVTLIEIGLLIWPIGVSAILGVALV
jgi:hypothetical protein